MQPSLTTLAVAAAFLFSVPAGRPLAERLAHDFVPLDPAVLRLPGVQKVFFAAEVGVDRPTRESGDLGDLLQGRPLEASPSEDLRGRLYQGGSGQFAASLWGETLDCHAPIMPRKFILDI